MTDSLESNDDLVCAVILDDVTDLLRKGQAKNTVLLGYQEKWLKAGASLAMCKVVRLLVASFNVRQEGRGASTTEAIATFEVNVRIAFGELGSGDVAIATNPDPAANIVMTNSPTALIMKGGGIKGLAYVGAIEQLDTRYNFKWFVGTSAGAVTAVLLGAGYNTAELKEILKHKNFKDFLDAPVWKWPLNLLMHHGIHPADTLTEWLDTLLARKLNTPTRVKLSDLPNRVTVYASRRNKPVLRFDSIENDVDAAYAVRCSMSIPIVFIPQTDQGFRAYDGGLQHNYPVRELLARHPGTPFVSLYLGPETYEPVRQKWVFSDLVSIWTEAGDHEALGEYREQTIIIDPRPIQTLDFSLADDEKDFLLLCGQLGAYSHLDATADRTSEARRLRDEAKAIISERKRLKRKFRLYILIAAVFFFATAYCLYRIRHPRWQWPA